VGESEVTGEQASSSRALTSKVDEALGAVFGQEIIADLLGNSPFLSPRQSMNNGSTAEAVTYDCSGRSVETGC